MCQNMQVCKIPTLNYAWIQFSIILDFIAKAEEFVDKLNFGSLLYLEKNVTNISLDAMNHSKDMIVIANTMNYNTTAVLALKDDFSVILSSFENAS